MVWIAATSHSATVVQVEAGRHFANLILVHRAVDEHVSALLAGSWHMRDSVALRRRSTPEPTAGLGVDRDASQNLIG
jgi:hypothetical protein